MTKERVSKPRCFIAIPFSQSYSPIRNAIQQGAVAAGYVATTAEDTAFGAMITDNILEHLTRADCVVAEITDSNPNVFYELGIATTMGKTILPIAQEGPGAQLPFSLGQYRHIVYRPTKLGLTELRHTVEEALRQLIDFPLRGTRAVVSRIISPFIVDWDRISNSEKENLCRELLMQMGYRQVNWTRLTPEFDLAAELPKKDPDGFEYRELWLVSMGKSISPPFLEMLYNEPEYLIYRAFRHDIEMSTAERDANNITALFIQFDDEIPPTYLDKLQHRMKRSNKRGPGVRIRIWTRDFLTQLVQQFPQIGYKYFSDQGRSRAKYRKSLDELYQENVELTEKQGALLKSIEEERSRRVRAERDAAWKDISFSAAHKIGNPIFAIETNIEPLRRRIREDRKEEALRVTDDIYISVEKAKDIVDQFKSLTKIQEMHPAPMSLLPVLNHSCEIAKNAGVACEVKCPEDLVIVADPMRIAECFDELIANAIHWLDKAEKEINVEVSVPKTSTLPKTLTSSRRYVRIIFRDNGPGIQIENKARIFDAFFTTREQGTGLGLALVRRIIEGHDGAISEIGSPTEGSIFEIFLPTTIQNSGEHKPSGAAHSKKRKEAP